MYDSNELCPIYIGSLVLVNRLYKFKSSLNLNGNNVPVSAYIAALEFSRREDLIDSGLNHCLQGLLRRRIPHDTARGGRR